MTDGHDADRLTLLHRLGAAKVRHNSHEDLVPHLCGTRDLLREWGARRALCDAGMFHSIYGTEYFTTETFSETGRAEVQAELSEETEAIIWLWCFGRRTSLEAGLARGAAPRMQERRSGEWLTITNEQYDDLVNLWIADTLEQIDRVPEREIPIARGLMEYRERALPDARRALEESVAERSTP